MVSVKDNQRIEHFKPDNIKAMLNSVSAVH